MAHRGALLLKKLRLQYCDWGGSSQGMREFVIKYAQFLQEQNPAVEVVAEVHRNRHPRVEGHFANGNVHVVGVKNLSSRQIMEHVNWLRASKGLCTHTKAPVKRQITQNRSIQGAWTVETFAS